MKLTKKEERAIQFWLTTHPGSRLGLSLGREIRFYLRNGEVQDIGLVSLLKQYEEAQKNVGA